MLNIIHVSIIKTSSAFPHNRVDISDAAGTRGKSGFIAFLEECKQKPSLNKEKLGQNPTR